MKRMWGSGGSRLVLTASSPRPAEAKQGPHGPQTTPEGRCGWGRAAGVPQAEPQPLTRACPCPPQSVMLQIAAAELEKEESRRESEKQNYLAESCPPLHIPGSTAEVQVPRARAALLPLASVSPLGKRTSRVVRAGGAECRDGRPPACPPPGAL